MFLYGEARSEHQPWLDAKRGNEVDEYKQRQRLWHDAHFSTYDPPILHAHGVELFYRTFEHRKAFRLLRQSGFPVKGRPLRVLVSCAGAGEDLVFWLARLPIKELCAIDLSIEACKLARRIFQDRAERMYFIQADAEHLPFRDSSFDLALVHNGLHHLPDPGAGLRELWRVADDAVAVIEPARTRLIPLFIRLGIAAAEEESGNKVLRFTKEDLLRWLGLGPRAKVFYRRYFWYDHGFLFERILPYLNRPGGSFTLQSILAFLDTFFFFLRTKSAAVILKNPVAS